MTALAAMFADTVIKSSIVLLLALGATIGLRRKSAALRHAIWTTGLFCALAIPFLGMLLPSWHPNLERSQRIEQPAAIIAATTAGATPSTATAPSPQTAPASIPSVTPVRMILLAWLVGFVTIAVILLVEVFKLARMAFGSDPVRQHSWIHLAREVSHALRLKRAVRLMKHPNASVLGTWGTLRPRVILPREAAAWSGERMRVVLGHELAHVKRNDWLVQIAAETARAIYWFNPLFWIACAQLRRESEYACDDTAMRLGVDGPTYASHVLDLARTLRYSGQPGAAALAMANPSNLERRLVAMLNPSLNRRTATRGTVALVILAALAITLPLAAMHPQSQPAPSREIQPAKPASSEMIRLPGGFQVTSDSLPLDAESIVVGGHVAMRQRKPNTSEVTAITASTSFSPAASPQLATGSISGTVSDSTGARVPGVRITITNNVSGVTVGALSNDSGAFSISGLSPGNYSMTAALNGFLTSKASSIPVQAGNNVQVKANLLVGGSNTTVDVVVSFLPESCRQLLGTVKADGTTYTRADCFELTAAERNAPPRTAPASPPDDIAILGTSPVALPQAQIPAINRQILRIGGEVQAGNLIYHPNPIYPDEARRIGIEGRVILSATIDVDGNVRALKVIDSSNPLLNQSPIDAIENWRYKPTLLNSQPIETTTTITVNFAMGR